MTQEKLETQRKIVLNERRQSYENRPTVWPSWRWKSTVSEGHPITGR